MIISVCYLLLCCLHDKVSCFTFKRLSMNLGNERGVCLIFFFQDEGFYLGLRNEGRGDGVEESWFS